MTTSKANNIGSIGRRVDSTIDAIIRNDYENALIHLFPALDKTAKRRRPKSGVGERIKAFIADQQIIITAIAFQNIFTQDCMFDGLTFSDAIYKFGRTSIAHEGELDERLRIIPGNNLRIGKVWELPASTVSAMAIAVIIAPENAHESSASAARIKILQEEFSVQTLWGSEETVKDLIKKVFQRDVFADV
jgi:hypothetical protein